MKAISRVFSFSLLATLVFFWPPHASAQSRGVDACAILAGSITHDIQGKVIPGHRLSIFQQVVRRQIYFKCLQLHGQQEASGAKAAAKAGTFITFDVPGSTCLPQFVACTRPTGINPAGSITGIYADANEAFHSFLRAPDGTFTTFDPPGSLTSFPSGINPAGTITGESCGAITCHAFLRASNGTFTIIDAPGAIFTSPSAISPAGAITGYYEDTNFVAHGFLRASNGTFTTIDVPAAANNGTIPVAIHSAGAITGYYYDANFASHGFVRGNSAITTFDPPGSL